MQDASPHKCRTTAMRSAPDFMRILLHQHLLPVNEVLPDKNITKVMNNSPSNSKSSWKIKGFFFGLFFWSKWSKAAANSSFRFVLALSFFGRYKDNLPNFKQNLKFCCEPFGSGISEFKKTHWRKGSEGNHEHCCDLERINPLPPKAGPVAAACPSHHLTFRTDAEEYG